MDKIGIGDRFRIVRRKILKIKREEIFYERYLAGKGFFKKERTTEGSRQEFMSKLENGVFKDSVYSLDLISMYANIGNVSIDYIVTGKEYNKAPAAGEFKTYSDLFSLLFQLYERGLFVPSLNSPDEALLKLGHGAELLQNTAFKFAFHKFGLEGPTPGIKAPDMDPEAQYILYRFLVEWQKVLAANEGFQKATGNSLGVSYYELWKKDLLSNSAKYFLDGKTDGECRLIDISRRQIQEIREAVDNNTEPGTDLPALAAVIMGD